MKPESAPADDIRRWAVRPLSPTQLAALNMYQGSHLGIGQGIEYWRGPSFDLLDTPSQDAAPTGTAGTTAPADQARAESFVKSFHSALRRSFTSTNLVRSVVDREVAHACARMTWQKLPGELEALTLEWWATDDTHVERVIRELLTTARTVGRAPWWFRVAGAALAAIPNPTPQDVLRCLRLEALPTDLARVDRDPDTFQRVGALTYTREGRIGAEVFWVDVTGLTQRRSLRPGQPEEPARPLRLGRRLPIGEVTLPPLISEQVLQNQMAYNTAKTMSVRNTELAGFVERYGIGLEPPYELDTDPVTGERKKRYLPVRVGGGSMTLWQRQAFDLTDADGNYLGERPSGSGEYGRLNPVSAEPLESVLHSCEADILKETGQGVWLTQGNTEMAARSREILLGEFDARQEVTRDACRYLIAQVLETALALAHALSGRSGEVVPAVTGQVQARAIQQTPEERAADLADWEHGLIGAGEIRARRGLDGALPRDVYVPPKPQPETPRQGSEVQAMTT